MLPLFLDSTMKPLIRIDLERPDGVYYAGEVVRGTVTIKAPGLQCKGAFLSFKGFSHVHWHEDNDNNILEGKSTFQANRQTLYGYFFSTGTLEGVGEDACFDRVPDSGVIHIPCDRTEEQNFQLVIRVHERKGGLLGELLLDVPQLVNSGTKQTFQLMRNGKIERGSVTLSAKVLPYEAVFPTRSRSGVKVCSIVLKPLCLVLRVHEALGLPQAFFHKQNNGVYVRAYHPAEAIVPDKMIDMPEEELTMPFSFQLRSDAPGSAELPASGPTKCHVRYTLRAYIHTTNWGDPSVKRVLQVIPNRPLPKMSLLAPARIEILDQPIYDCTYCGCSCCKLSGLISTKLHLERLVYAPGEKVRLAGEIVNDSDKSLPFFVVLTLCVSMRTSRGIHDRRDCYFDLFQSSVPARSTVSLGELTGIQHVRIPRVFPSFDGGVPKPHSADFYPCLKWSYTLEVRVGAKRDNCCGMTAVQSRIPILICAAVPYSHQIEAARDRDMPQIAMTDPFAFLEAHAVTDLEGCDTAPTVKGPEDGGVTLVAQYTGPINAFEVDEDAYNVDLVLLNYQPMVNTFFDASSDKPNASADTDEFKTVSHETTDKAVNDLLKELEVSLEKRRVIRKWLQTYHLHSQNLSPEDFRRILDKVSFSSDKNAVIGELLAAFESTGKLKCAHIVAAMESCSFQKADVAKLMAPHVSDPENKDIVLQQIELSFEREKVASKFL